MRRITTAAVLVAALAAVGVLGLASRSPSPGRSTGIRHRIHAGESGAAASIASGEALVRSFRFRPPVEPLRPDPIAAVDVAARAIRDLARQQRDFACFPALPGGTARGVLHREPLGPELQRPFAVECRTDVEATALQLWRVDLIFRWAAGPTYPAGRTVTTVWVDVDGAIAGSQAASGDPVPIAIVAPGGGT